nr:hypothetical protein [uncultured bacterium]
MTVLAMMTAIEFSLTGFDPGVSLKRRQRLTFGRKNSLLQLSFVAGMVTILRNGLSSSLATLQS